MKFIYILMSFLLAQSLWAQTPVVGRGAATKKTGKESAQEYFKSDAEKNEVNHPSESSSGPRYIQSGEHYLAISAGNHIQGDAWGWGQKEKQKNTGAAFADVTYRYDEWGQTDLDIRIDFSEYSLLDERPMKMAFMPLIVFPEASSKFPLYFGAGAGLGVFFKQLPDESNVTFDYILFMGARFFNVYGSTGFFIETGLKNHLHLTSDGQFNGTYLAGGAVFTF